MEKNKRVAIVVSIFWIIIAFNTSLGYSGFDWFLVLASPVFIYWAIKFIKVSIMRTLVCLLGSYLLLLTPVKAGYAEEFMIGTLMAYSAYCEEMTDKGLYSFSVYVVDNMGSAEDMDSSKAYKTAHNALTTSIGSESFRPTACNQIKKALQRKDFYWLFEKQ